MESEPLAPDAAVVIAQNPTAFEAGVKVVCALTDGKTYLCKKLGSSVADVAGSESHNFSGPHPAGLAGTHMHFLDAPSATSGNPLRMKIKITSYRFLERQCVHFC